jgi:phosphate transport system permease protein
VSFGIALFLTEMSVALKRPLGTTVELLAAIPSIIMASGACSSSRPVRDYVQPLLTRRLGTFR